MLTTTTTFGPGDLLEYNSKHRLLICRQCQYAIQKNALESHLLRHKIYRLDRQRLLSSIAQHDLLEPDNVLLPAAGSPPVDTLPILSGYCCTAERCRHLTASSKRMKRHWSETHGLDGSVPLSSSLARPVKLQTFFRGTKIRYFEVASPIGPLVNSDDDDGDDGGGGGGDGHHEAYEDEGHNALTVTPSLQPLPSQPPLSPPPPPPQTVQGPSSADFNLETLTYFYYFSTITSLTLPGTEDPQSTAHYWQTDVVLRALQRRWLMCGLLAISAHHLATLADEPSTKLVHRERGVQFSSEFCAGLRQTTECLPDVEAAEIEKEVKQTGEQISCLLRCAEWPLVEPSFDPKLAAPGQLLSFMSIVRGCAISNSTLHHGGILNDYHGGREELSVQGVLHTRNSSYGGNPHTNSPNNNTPSILTNLLEGLPSQIAKGLGRPENAQDVLATLSAISTVEKCCDISFARDEAATAWQGVATWLANIPDHFNQMLGRHNPAALVVLAHWAAILIKRAERVGCWFLQGSAKMILRQVATQLSTANGHHPLLGLVERLRNLVEE